MPKGATEVLRKERVKTGTPNLLKGARLGLAGRHNHEELRRSFFGAREAFCVLTEKVATYALCSGMRTDFGLQINV
jgi:hypothetical protein